MAKTISRNQRLAIALAVTLTGLLVSAPKSQQSEKQQITFNGIFIYSSVSAGEDVISSTGCNPACDNKRLRVGTGNGTWRFTEDGRFTEGTGSSSNGSYTLNSSGSMTLAWDNPNPSYFFTVRGTATMNASHTAFAYSYETVPVSTAPGVYTRGGGFAFVSQ